MVKGSLIPAAGYVRMSGRQQEKSPAEQRDEITRLAEREGFRVVEWFEDMAITGDSGADDRPGLAGLLAAVESGKVKAVLAWHTNRVSREDPMDALQLYNRLRKAGVGLVTCCEGHIDLTDFAKQLLLFVNQKGSNDFLVELAAKSLRGKIAGAKAGHHMGGPVHYGLDRALFDSQGCMVRRLAPGETVRMAGHHVRLVPSTDAAKVQAVRWAFTRFDAADVSLRGLAEELERKGFPSPRGTGWTSANVGRLLRTAAYAGTSSFGREAWGDYYRLAGSEIAAANGNAGKCVRKPQEDILRVPGAYEGIIPVDLFERVQDKLAQREKPRARPRRKAEFPLTGLIVCTHCGQPMHGETGHGPCSDPRYTYHRYTCSTYLKFHMGTPRNPTCGHFSVRADRVQRWLVHKLQETFLGPGRAVLVQEVKAYLAATTKATASDVGRLEKRVGDLDREVARLVKAIRSVDAAELTEELVIVRAERDRVRAELTQASKLAAVGGVDVEAERIVDTLSTLGKRLTSGDPALVREAFRQFVARIECCWEVRQQGRRRRYELVRGEVHLQPQVMPDCPDSLTGVVARTSPHTFPGRMAC